MTSLVHMFFGLSNKPEMSRMLWALSVLAGIIYTGVHLVLHGVFNIIEFGAGMAAILAGGGAATMMKDTGAIKVAAQRATQKVEVVNEADSPVPVDQK